MLLHKLQKLKVSNPGAVPLWAKKIIWSGMRITSSLRTSPDFLIIGAQKSGTTSLFSYLASHPQVLTSLKKEPCWFGCHSDKPRQWYRAHFPTRMAKDSQTKSLGKNVVVGEASTNYLFHPKAAQQAHSALPDAKIVAMLRDPVDRALSQYFFYVKKGLESEDINSAFESAIKNFDEDYDRWMNWSGTIADLESAIRTYLLRGLYEVQLESWKRFFPDSILVLEKIGPQEALEKVIEFLGLDAWQPDSFRTFNQGSYDNIPEGLRERLQAFYDQQTTRQLTKAPLKQEGAKVV